MPHGAGQINCLLFAVQRKSVMPAREWLHKERKLPLRPLPGWTPCPPPMPTSAVVTWYYHMNTSSSYHSHCHLSAPFLPRSRLDAMPTTYADFRARVSKLSVRPLAESEQGIKGLPVGRWGPYAYNI